MKGTFDFPWRVEKIIVNGNTKVRVVSATGTIIANMKDCTREREKTANLIVTAVNAKGKAWL